MSATAIRLVVPWRWPWRRRDIVRPRGLLERLAGPLDDMLQVLVQEAGVGIAVVDRQGRLVRVNDALRRMVDSECDVSPGRPVQELFCQHRGHEVWDELGPALAGQRPPRAFVSMLRSKDGMAESTVEISAVAIREADASISGAILQLNDITTQRRLEAQLAQSQKLQAVGQLAGGIAHDFNNLLTAVIGAADATLARELPDAETVEDIEQIRGSAERGAALVRQLLAFGRQQTLQPRPVSINRAVESLTGLLRRLLGSTIRLDLQLEQPDRTVQVDPTQLDQVLVNLAVNARDAMPDGGQLTLRTGDTTLYRALVRGEEAIPPGRYVMVEVQDTGVGIPPDILPRIFDPFLRPGVTGAAAAWGSPRFTALYGSPTASWRWTAWSGRERGSESIYRASTANRLKYPSRRPKSAQARLCLPGPWQLSPAHPNVPSCWWTMRMACAVSRCAR